MAKFAGRRLAEALPVLFGLTFVAFAFVHLLPGDPSRVILGQHATPAAVARLRQTLGLDQSLLAQYGQYLSALVHGNLGNSVINNAPVSSEFLVRFPGTVELTAAAMLIAVGVGVPMGRLAARYAQSPADAGVTALSVLAYSVPVFVLGLVLQYVFSVRLGWLPTTGQLDARLNIPAVTNFSLIDTLLAGDLGAFVDALRHLILPAVALASGPLALFARITRASVLEVDTQDYVRTAKAKGLSARRTSRRHVMRNAWLPVTTVIGLQVGSLLAGAVLTETIFAWNGVGSWVVQAVQDRDYLVVESLILLIGVIFILANLAVDVAYGVLNPRLRGTM